MPRGTFPLVLDASNVGQTSPLGCWGPFGWFHRPAWLQKAQGGRHDSPKILALSTVRPHRTPNSGQGLGVGGLILTLRCHESR